MKKLVMVFALGAMLGSCGDAEDGIDKISAIDIDVATLDSPCACAEAMVAIYDEIIDLSKGDDKTADQKIKTLEDKLEEIETDKCTGDLTPTLVGEDCSVQQNERNKKFMEYLQVSN
jgi:Skp family chaperone for outer membrane proteins